MQILRIDPVKDLEEWLDFRRPRIMGSTAKSTMPLSRGADRTPAGFWDVVGGMLTKAPEVEKAIDRGHRLEEEAIDKLSIITGLVFDKKPGVWISDTDEYIALSPDGAEPGDKPTYSAEVKNLAAGKHFKYMYKARAFEGNPIDLVPNEASAYYKEQCLQYFVVNKDLQKHYFVLHNPDAAFPEHEMVVIEIKREDVQELVDAQEKIELDTLERARAIVRELLKNYKEVRMSNRLDQEREALLQPQRMKTCQEKLESLGFQVSSFGGDRLEFEYKGSTIKFWPYSGWHSGKTVKDGRGFSHLLSQITEL